MEIHVIIGYVLATVMGLTLGIFGGGGSILSVPILVYVFGISPILSTAYSLFVVGIAALVGAIKKHFEKEIAYKIGVLFAIPSILTVYITRRFIIPFIPENLFNIGSFTLTKDIGIMIFFAIVMLIAARAMIKERKNTSHKDKDLNIPLLIGEGVFVGLITGLVGAGGGFLIVPALVLLVGLSMKEAVATSLVIITLKSLIGFLGDMGSGQNIDWNFLLIFTGFAILGMVFGLAISKKVNSKKLKKAFGYFILGMAVFIIIIEIFNT
ncbi:MAG: sulfite exporter TauE/SafE family protein [Bacteroidia bacterium]|nr:sulfite exporter TauE/SafE family protein [Bacteroidia bacterium]NNJ56469.1 sulfite exporter TauE/SafE family protein [Bacteroidia bacterium]